MALLRNLWCRMQAREKGSRPSLMRAVTQPAQRKNGKRTALASGPFQPKCDRFTVPESILSPASIRMTYFITGFLLLAGFLFWGVGLAVLVTPARYGRFALIFAAPAGIALQSLTVWGGAHSWLKGTDVYGRASLAIPAILLVVAWLYRRGEKAKRRPVFFTALLALMVVQLTVMVVPFALSGRELTTVSIGSLDAPDYGAGARVFQEFAWKDRSGFIGQSEVVSVGVVHNFFDFWLRTNHFTPSALIALNGSILGLKPYQLTSLMTIVLLTATLPMVFWLARAGLRYRMWPSLAVTAIFAFSPINWYAVYQVSPAQIIAANSIALLTWCGLAYWRQGAVLSGGWRWVGLLFISYGLIFGGYNFIIVVSLVPLLAYVGGSTLWSGSWLKLGHWMAVMLGMLVVSGLIYFERGAGVVERLILFNNGFGWAVSVLTPEGWLGFLDGPWLDGYATALRIPVAISASALMVIPLFIGACRKLRVAFLALCIALPVLFGYWYLQLRVASIGASASYEAYKLFAVFYPGMLAAFCYWGNAWWKGSGRVWSAVGLGFLVAVNFAGEWRLFYRLQTPPFVVDEEILALGKIEQMPQIQSVNMRLEDGWARLWANAFLLRKHQFFEITSYEGRGATELKGEWDLLGDFFQYDLSNGDSLHPAAGYTVLKRQSPCFIEADFSSGWAEPVRDDPRPVRRVRWAEGALARVTMKNPQAVPLRITLQASLRAIGLRDCLIKIAGEEVARLKLEKNPQIWTDANLVLPPGETTIEFSSSQPADLVGGRKKQAVTIAVDGIDIRVLGRIDGSAPAQ